MDIKPKKISYEILTEDQIRQEEKIKDHLRKQILLDTVNNVIQYTVIIVPILLLTWAIIIAVHYLVIGDWKSFDELGKAVGYVVVGYVISYLQQQGINRK